MYIENSIERVGEKFVNHFLIILFSLYTNLPSSSCDTATLSSLSDLGVGGLPSMMRLVDSASSRFIS